LGRISNALALVIDQLPESERQNKAIKDFTEMKAQIDEIKRTTEAARFDKMLADLHDLRQHDEKTFAERLRHINALAKP
jgi:hypothetical protein